jgi:hypothetical protein
MVKIKEWGARGRKNQAKKEKQHEWKNVLFGVH